MHNNLFEQSHQTPIKIVGMGSSIGSKRITNKDLESKLGLTTDEIEFKTGIKYRFHCDTSKENLYVLMASATDQAMTSAGISIKNIDGIFSACNPTGEFLLPNTSTIVASLLNIESFYNGGNSTGCSGGLIALDMAFNRLVRDSEQGRVKNYLVLAGDQTSVMIKPGSSDEMLFSDGSSALIVTNNKVADEYYKVVKVNNITFSEKACALKLTKKHRVLEHDGRAVYKFATGSMDFILDMLGVDKFPEGTYLIPHQANLRIINSLTKGINPDLVYKKGVINIGNTSPASVFIGLEEVNRQKLSSHNNLVLATFGEGLTVAVAKLEANSKKLLQEKKDDGDLKKEYMNVYKEKWQ